MSTPTSPAGRVDIQGDQATLHFERTLPHPPDVVWDALVSPGHLARWYMADVTLEPRVGGTIALVTGPARFHATGTILEWEPLHRFAYGWNVAPRPELPAGEASVVRWVLAADGAGTALTLTHEALSRATAIGLAPGMHALLDRLAALLDEESMPMWMARYEAVKGLYPAWQAAT